MQKILLASHNKGKLFEFGEALKPKGFEVISALDLDLDEPEETENTFEGNALLKAKAATKNLDIPVIADDSGLAVDALNGDPGIYSARWAYKDGSSERDFDYAMNRVWQGIKDQDNHAVKFVAVIAVIWPDGKEKTYRGEVEGKIIWPARGEKGFGYDPIFQPNGYDKTFAEDPELKKICSHRHKAIEKMLEDF